MRLILDLVVNHTSDQHEWFRRAVAEDGGLDHVDWIRQRSETRLHRITSPTLMTVGASSKLNAEWAFLSKLRETGRQAASEFLEAHSADLGQRSTADLGILLEVENPNARKSDAE